MPFSIGDDVKTECDAKQRLLDTAIDLIWEQSYGAVSVDVICERAGTKKGSFYHFFPSKSDLTVAAIERTAVQLRGQQLVAAVLLVRSLGGGWQDPNAPSSRAADR
jgi:AcrR family transcriptional regulator